MSTPRQATLLLELQNRVAANERRLKDLEQLIDHAIGLPNPAARTGELLFKVSNFMANFASESQPGDDCTDAASHIIRLIAHWIESESFRLGIGDWRRAGRAAATVLKIEASVPQAEDEP